MKTTDHLLILFTNIEVHELWITEILKKSGFLLTIKSNSPDTVDPDNFGSIIVFSTTDNPFQIPLKKGLDISFYEKEEFYFGDNDELYCTWLLTDHASPKLKEYVRTLWSILNIS